MKMGVKNRLYKFKRKINRMVDIISLNIEINYLENELKESKKREQPYIDKINGLKSELRTIRIIKTKLEKKVGDLNEQLNEYKRKYEPKQTKKYF